MNPNFFLYRRLSRWITCEFKLPTNGRVALENKYEVASFQDVFCHPFYWQVFQFIDEPPNLVVDCGAHCGHFSILADICFRSKFNFFNTEYLLIEPNPHLLPIINKNLEDADLVPRTKLIPGLLGSSDSQGILWVHPKNYLAASLQQTKGAKAHTVNYINLLEIVGDRTIDLIKIDIEGAEYNFIEQNRELLHHVNLIFLELHPNSHISHDDFIITLESLGLDLVAKPLEAHANTQLMIFKRKKHHSQKSFP